MELSEKIKIMRDMNHWTQEDVAEKLGISTTGYAKIERGETKLSLHKLEQIANIFNIDVLELMNTGGKGIVFLMNENSDNSSNYYSDNLATELEKFKMIVAHKDEIIQQKNDEICALKEIIALLKSK